MNDTFDVTCDLRFGERSTFKILSTDDIESNAPEESGIYAWFAKMPLRTPPSDTYRAYIGLYAGRELAVSLTSDFGLIYHGCAEQKTPRIRTLQTHAAFLNQATIALAPPLYIGISSNLRRRLREHLGALQDALRSRKPLGNGSAEDATDDTEEESRCFGERVGSRLLQAGMDSPQWLFVKVLPLPNTPRPELLDLERILNVTYIPVCGRK